MSWYDRAMEELEHNLYEGVITQDEFRRAVRELNQEHNDAANEAAEEARQDYFGGGW